MPGERHNGEVAVLVSLGAKSRGFWKALRDIFDEDDDYGMRLLPDAYRIDRWMDRVVCYEVEHTSALTKERLHRYGMLWFYLDSIGWTLDLVLIGRRGAKRMVCGQCLYYSLLLEQSRGGSDD